MRTKESAFVVSARENLPRGDEEFVVVGAYRSFGDAVKACVDTIIDRMAVHEIAATMRNDESRMPGWTPPETDAAWRVFIEHELVTQRCYYPRFGGVDLRYDIDEVDIVGHGGRNLRPYRPKSIQLSTHTIYICRHIRNIISWQQ